MLSCVVVIAVVVVVRVPSPGGSDEVIFRPGGADKAIEGGVEEDGKLLPIDTLRQKIRQTLQPSVAA